MSTFDEFVVILKHILNKLERIMALQDDLLAAVTALATGVQTLTSNISANDAAIKQELSALAAALASGNSTALTGAVSTAITNLGTLSSAVTAASASIANETASLLAALPPVTTTAPATTTPTA